MKKYIFLLCSIGILSCSSSEEPGDVITNEFERIRFVLPRGSWEIKKLILNNENHTPQDSIVFLFKDDNSLQITHSDTSSFGKWHYESLPGLSEKLILEIPSPMENLDASWKINSTINAEVKLSKEISDTLIFSRRE